MKLICDSESRYHPMMVRVEKLLNRVEYTQREMVWFASEVLWCNYPLSSISIRPCVRVKDATNQEQMVDLFFNSIEIHDQLSDDLILDIIYRSIMKFEIHEMQEHFYVDGFKVHDPHKNDPKDVQLGPAMRAREREEFERARADGTVSK